MLRAPSGEGVPQHFISPVSCSVFAGAVGGGLARWSHIPPLVLLSFPYTALAFLLSIPPHPHHSEGTPDVERGEG